jgi:hypothetical protein
LLKALRTAAAAAALTFLLSPGARAQSWELLGTTTSEPRIEQSIIQMGKRDGQYQAIRLEVQRNDAQILDVRVVYGNGRTESFQVRDIFRAGSSSRRIALSGGDRFLKQVVVTYRALGPVQVNVYGEPSETSRWVELGCKSVGFAIDRDVVRLNRQEGAFKSIRLRVIGNRIDMYDLRVVYGNGAPDDLRVRTVIPDRGQTPPIDLRGERRALDRIEMIYRSQPNFRGQAVVCVDGLRIAAR